MKKLYMLFFLTYTIHGMEKPVKLTNSGNSCFINAALQSCLTLERCNTHLMMHKDNYAPQSISALYIEFLEKTKTTDLIRPEALCKKGWELLNHKNNSQQDAGEFLLFLINQLTYEDMVNKGSEYYPQSQKPINELTKLFTIGLKSIVSYGPRISENILPLAFKERGRIATFETPSAIELSIDYKDRSLEDCIHRFFKIEKIEFTTPHGQKTVANKKYQLITTNEYSIMNLKRRFHILLEKTCLFGRDETALSFPLNNFEIGFHRYKLLAVIMHSGTAEGGHYTAYTLKNNQWYYTNDAEITTIDDESMKSIAERGYGVNETTLPVSFIYSKEL